MSIGQDIAEVLDELGMTVEVRRPYTDEYDWFREKVEISAMERTTQPFFREYMVMGSFRFDTKIVSGDVLSVVTTGLNYLVLSLHPEGFEDGIIECSSFLYKCNTVGITLQQIGTGEWDSSYKNVAEFTPAHKYVIPALFYDVRQFDRTGAVLTDWGNIASISKELHISGFYPLPNQCRFRIFDTTKQYEWIEWEDSVEYAKGGFVLSSDYRLFKSLGNNNLDNDPLYTSQDDFEDEYYVKYWQEIPYKDMHLGKAELSRFENVVVYTVSEDTR